MISPSNREIEFRAACSIADYLFLRRLRNEVRGQLTNDTAKLGYLRQLRFYISRPAGLEIHVAWLRGRRAGYLLLRRADGTCYVTEAVATRFRRQGIGLAMVRFAIERATELTAEIRASNTASIKLHRAAGFCALVTDGPVVTYRYRRPGAATT